MDWLADTIDRAQESLVYEAHWNVKSKPFENDFDTSYFVDTKSHREALNRVVFAAAERKSLVLLTAEHGLGKTFIGHVAMNKLASQGGAVGLISDPTQSADDLLRQVNSAFGLTCDTFSKHDLIESLHQYLIGVARGGGRSTLFVDNADTITDPAALTELRKLLDLSTSSGQSLLTIVLMAHPSFHAVLREEPGLVQRIDVGAGLEALDFEDTKSYLLQRIRLANGPRHMFENGAIQTIYQASKGIPRLINRLCDFALVIGTMQGLQQVTGDLAEEAVEEVRKLSLLSRGLTAGRAIEAVDMPTLSSPKGRRAEYADSDRRDRDDRGRSRRDRDDRRGRRDRDDRERGDRRDRDDRDDRRSRRDRDDRDDRRSRRDRDDRNDRRSRRDRDDRRGDREERRSDRDDRRSRRDRDDRERSDRRDRDDRGRRGKRRSERESEPLAFNREEHLDIQSMEDLIRNDLKVTPANNRRGGRSQKNNDKDNVVEYFGMAASDKRDKERRETAEATEDTKKERRPRRSRGDRPERGERKERGDREERGERKERGDREERGGRRSRRDRDERPSRRSRSKDSDAKIGVVDAPAQAPEAKSLDTEALAAFGDGLVEVSAEEQKKALAEQKQRLNTLRELHDERARRQDELRKAAEESAAADEDEGGFGMGLIEDAEESKEAPKAKAKKAKKAKKAEEPAAEEPNAEEAPSEETETKAEAKDEVKAEDSDAEAKSEESEEKAEEAKPKARRTRTRKSTKAKKDGDAEEKPKKRAPRKKAEKTKKDSEKTPRRRVRKKADKAKDEAVEAPAEATSGAAEE